MTINSDKENKKSLVFLKKIKSAIFDDLHQTTIMLIIPILIFLVFKFFPEILITSIIGTVISVFIIALLTDGKMFGDYKAMAWVFNIIFVLTFALWYSLSYTEKQIDTMDLKPYIKSITSNKDNDIFKIEFILPFNEHIETSLNSSKFQPLFASKDHFKEFKILAVKTCYKYRFKDVSCSTSMIIKHPSTMEPVFEIEMPHSLYPKKLSFEIEQEKEDGNGL